MKFGRSDFPNAKEAINWQGSEESRRLLQRDCGKPIRFVGIRGELGEGRSIRYLEWTYDPDESDTTIVTGYVFLLREGEQPVRVEHDQHITGLFSREQWLSILKDTGFQASFVMDPF